jgi:hypothetical protein
MTGLTIVHPSLPPAFRNRSARRKFLLPGGRRRDEVTMAPLPRIGFHASHEQFPPSELLALARQAEAAGFDCAMSSDHFRPWGTTANSTCRTTGAP